MTTTAQFGLRGLVAAGLLAASGWTAWAQPILSIDFNERGQDTATYTMPGFQPFVIDSVGSATAAQGAPSVRTFGAFTVTVSGSVPGITYDDRLRSTPTDSGAFTESLLLRDFIFCGSTTNGTGLDIAVDGLLPDHVYQVKIWSFDTTSTGNRVSDWYANGTPVRTDYVFNGSNLPTDNNTYTFTFKATTTAQGRLLFQGRRDAATSRDGSVFVNAFTIEEAPPDPPSFLVQPGDATVFAGELAVLRAEVGGTAPLFFQWLKNDVPIPGATNSLLVLANVQPSDSALYRLAVSNAVGADLSNEAYLQVDPVGDIRTALLAYWPLDQLDATTPDVSGNANDLTANNLTPNESVPGRRGNAVLFNGTSALLVDDLAGSATLPAYSHPAYTVTLWVKGSYVNQSDRRVFSESSSANQQSLLNIGTHNSASSGVVDIFIRTDSGATLLNHRHSSLIAFDDTWHHIAWVDDKGFPRLYVDGVQDTNDFNYTRGLLTLNLLTVGGILRSAPSHWFAGSIDDVAVWGRALSPYEVQYAMLRGGEPYPEVITDLKPTLPADVSANEREGARFTVAIYGQGASYQWYKEGVPISGATEPVYAIAAVTPANAGNYCLVAQNAGGSLTSRVATLTVIPDTTPPFLMAVSSGGTRSTVRATFSEALAPASASQLGNYRLSAAGGLSAPTVAEATLVASNVVLLTLAAPREYGVEYFLSVSGVTDLAYTPNPVFPATLPIPVESSVLVFDFNQVWRYNTNGVDLGTAWKEETYDDAAWPAGEGLLGAESEGIYPEPIRTYFSNYSTATVTYYFRTRFNYTNNLPGWVLVASNYVDDGAVYWLNGREAGTYRMNPGGTNLYNTLALGEVAEGQLGLVVLGADALRPGTNTLAVEVHQGNANSSDILFGTRPYLVKPTPLTLTAQPTNLQVVAGQSGTLRVSVSGSFPQYQWLRDGALLAGANGATLAVTNAGNYAVVVANSLGALTSQVAVVTVVPNQPPVVTYALMQTNGVSTTYGSVCTVTVQFSEPVNAADATNLANYFIVREGDSTNTTLPIYEATLASGTNLTLVTAAKVDQQNYQLFIGNIRDTATSPAMMTTTSLFLNLRFFILGAGQLWRYDWNGADLGTAWRQPGYNDSAWGLANGPFYSADSDIANLEPAAAWGVEAGLYLPVSDVVTTYYFRTTFDLPASPAGAQLQFEIYADDGAVFYLNGREVQFTASPGRYYMTNDATPVTAAALAIDHVLNSGNIISQRTPLYPLDLRASGNVLAVELHKGAATNTLTGFGLRLVATTPPLGKPVRPQFNAQPPSVTTNAGAVVTLAAAVDGTMPITGRWYLNGTNLVGSMTISAATNVLTLTRSNVGLGDEGAYTLVLSNSVGVVTSAVATLTVLRPPVFAVQPASTNVTTGAPALLAAIVEGSAPISYQWYFNGVLPLFGQTSNTLTFLSVQAGNAGDYTVVAANSSGTVTSAVARLSLSTNVAPNPPKLVAAGLVGGGAPGFALELPTQPGFVYALESADELASPPTLINWQPVAGSSVMGDGSTKTLADPAAIAVRRFYRVKVSVGN